MQQISRQRSRSNRCTEVLPLLATLESKKYKHEYGFLHDNLPQTLLLWQMFTVTSPSMDFETIIIEAMTLYAFGILPSVLQEVVKLLYIY